MSLRRSFIAVFFCLGFVLSGCRGYIGYRNFSETTDLNVENEDVIDTTHDIYLENNKIFVAENKKIAYTQNFRIDQIEERLYIEGRGAAVVANVIFLPVTIIFSPLAVLVLNTEEVEFEKNKYTYSYGRKVWNFLNICVRTTSGDTKKEREVTDSETKKEDRLRSEKRSLDNAEMLIEVNNKRFKIKSGADGKTIAASIFAAESAQNRKQIKVMFKKKSKFFMIDNTGVLMPQ